MGFPKGATNLLFELKKDTQLNGVIGQLGKQATDITPYQLESIAQSFGIQNKEYIFSHEKEALREGMVSDIDLFKFMGFETVESIDCSRTENPTHIVDLNHQVPSQLHQRYDVIYDGGTVEHIFNFPQVLQNIHTMLKPNGIIIHATVSHNHVDHGFYMFSPELFYNYYYSNKYDILRSYIYEYEFYNPRKSWIVYRYTPGSIDAISWGKKKLGIWFVARKKRESICTVIPQQNFFATNWKKLYSHGVKQETVQKIKARLKKGSLIFLLAERLYKLLKRYDRPTIIARYK